MKRALVIAVATALIFAAVAQASAPPRGRYGCTIGGGYSGELSILDASHYRIDHGPVGRFQAKGHTIKILSGSWAGLFRGGRWRVGKGPGNRPQVEIAMTDTSGYENTYCDKE